MTSQPRLSGIPPSAVLVPMIVAACAFGAFFPALGLSSAGAAETAILEGSVDFTGLSPAAAPRPRSRYPARSSTRAADPPPPLAVIYIEGDFGEAALAAARARPEKAAPVLNQAGLRFVPHLLAVIAGGSVSFPNNDDTFHNVFSYSSTRTFDLGRYLRDETPPAVVFDKTGIAKIFCEIHHHMRATILVLDTPHFTLTDEQGDFRIEGVPPGRYRVTAWIDERNVWTREVAFRAGETARLRFTGS